MHTHMYRHRKNGACPVHVAAQNGHEEVVRFLIEARADVQQADDDGASPVYIAWQEGHEEVVRCLIEAREDVQQADAYKMRKMFIRCLYAVYTVFIRCLFGCLYGHYMLI